MQVFVNRASKPTLRVARMEDSDLPGALTFSAPAKYANLVVMPAPPAVAKTPTEPKASNEFLR